MKTRAAIPTLYATVILISFIGGGLAVGQSSSGNQPNVAEADKANDDDGSTAYLTMSGQLARIAQETDDPILMLAAARLEASVTLTEEERDKVATGGSPAAADKPATEDLYALAEQLAAGNEGLLAVISESKALDSTGTKGATYGSSVTYERVLAGGTDVYRVTFDGGRMARVQLAGDGDTDLDLRVYDERGNLACSDLGWSDVASCAWRPRWTGVFRIEIENLGDVWNAYRLSVN